MADPGKVLQCAAELVVRIVRILVRSCPAVQIHVYYLLIVEHDLYAAAFAGKGAAVPPTGLADHVFCWNKAIVNCSCSSFSIKILSSVRITDLHFDAGINGILQIRCSEERILIEKLLQEQFTIALFQQKT
jgi:hypothetical protein